jgi:Protein of unknown function (DUF3224)
MRGFTVDATFEVTSWDEEPFDTAVGVSKLTVSKLTKASVQKKYSGDVGGTSATEWLMSYNADGSATFVGLERIRGKIGGHKGTLVLQHVGEFRDGSAKATLTVVGGTDELGQATGGGDFLADPAGSISLSIST